MELTCFVLDISVWPHVQMDSGIWYHQDIIDEVQKKKKLRRSRENKRRNVWFVAIKGAIESL